MTARRPLALVSGLSQELPSSDTLAAIGVQFPATQVASADPNCLDDYEEGTFTPVLTIGGATTGITYGAQLGKYVKIGSLVVFTVVISLTSKGSATGAVQITALPFTSAAAAPTTYGMLFLNNVTAVGVGQAAVNVADTTLSLFNFTGSALAGMAETNLQNTSAITYSSFYYV